MAKLTPRPKTPALVRAAGTTLVVGSLLIAGCGDDATPADAGFDGFFVGITAPDAGDAQEAQDAEADAPAEIDTGISAPEDAGDSFVGI